MALFGRRVAARFLDTWLLAFGVLFSWGLGFLSVAGDCAPDHLDCKSGLYNSVAQSIGITVALLGTALPVFYDAICVMRCGKTAGKSALGIGVANFRGGRPRLWQCLVRSAVYWATLPTAGISIFIVTTTPDIEVTWKLPILIASVFVALTSMAAAFVGNRSIHDRAARTQVVALR